MLVTNIMRAFLKALLLTVLKYNIKYYFGGKIGQYFGKVMRQGTEVKQLEKPASKRTSRVDITV